MRKPPNIIAPTSAKRPCSSQASGGDDPIRAARHRIVRVFGQAGGQLGEIEVGARPAHVDGARATVGGQRDAPGVRLGHNAGGSGAVSPDARSASALVIRKVAAISRLAGLASS